MRKIGRSAIMLGMFATTSMALAQGRAPARAQTPAPPPVSAEPQTTTARFGDWTLRCERSAAGVRVCEVANSVIATAQGQSGAIAQLAIGRIAKGEPLRLTLVLPNNVSLTALPRIAPDDKAKPWLEASWRRCLPGGCYADAPIEDATLNALKARAEPARLVFKDGAERDVALPFSTRGLTQALDALAKEG